MKLVQIIIEVEETTHMQWQIEIPEGEIEVMTEAIRLVVEKYRGRLN